MNIDIDLEGMIAKAAADAFEPARIQEMLTEQLKSSVKTAISSAFAYRSKFQTMLDERISEAMPSDLEDLGRFGDVVLKQTKIYIQNYMEEQAATMLQARMTELLKPFDKEITLSELVKRLTEKFYDEFYGDCNEEKPTFLYLEMMLAIARIVLISMPAKPPTPAGTVVKYKPDLRMAIAGI